MNLNPCPICNSNELTIKGVGFNAIIKCDKCGYLIGGMSEKKTLISIWNKKAFNKNI